LVSWGRAFKAAGLTILYWIAWGIVGGIIMSAGIFATNGAYNAQRGIVDSGGFYGGIVLIIIGSLIMMLGFYATIYKVGAEIIRDEIRSIGVGGLTPTLRIPSTTTAPPPPNCPTCGQPLTYVPQYQKWYCQNEKKYF